MAGIHRGLIGCFLIIMLAGCSHSEEKKVPPLTTLKQQYPGDLRRVDQIMLRDGSTGARVTIHNKHEIDSFLDRIKDAVLQPDNNQEERIGFIYGVQLYEDEEVKLGFTPYGMNGVYYQENRDLKKEIQTYFEQKFNKKFER